jgi:hypothetical protein
LRFQMFAQYIYWTNSTHLGLPGWMWFFTKPLRSAYSFFNPHHVKELLFSNSFPKSNAKVLPFFEFTKLFDKKN